MSDDRYPEIRRYLEVQANTSRGMLCVVAARTRLPEGDLHDIVAGEDISDEIAKALRPLVEE